MTSSVLALMVATFSLSLHGRPRLATGLAEGADFGVLGVAAFSALFFVLPMIVEGSGKVMEGELVGVVSGRKRVGEEWYVFHCCQVTFPLLSGVIR